MSPRARYVFVASIDVDQEREHLFHEVYDGEHVPNLMGVPGVRNVTRYESQEFTLSIGGQLRHEEPAAPKFHAFYEIDEPDVLVSRAWAEAIERGRWPTDVRPFTINRRHWLMRRIGD